MSKKFSIIKELDLEKLDKGIDEYSIVTGEVRPYIFMSKDTIASIANKVSKYDVKVNLLNEVALRFTTLGKGGSCGLYNGYKIFENNDLAYGEVEIR